LAGRDVHLDVPGVFLGVGLCERHPPAVVVSSVARRQLLKVDDVEAGAPPKNNDDIGKLKRDVRRHHGLAQSRCNVVSAAVGSVAMCSKA
jgi:hypothetical protein